MSERRNDQNHGDNDNQAVLNEIVRNTEMGKNSLDQLIDVTDDRQLKASLLAQQKEYRRINQQAHAAMAALGEQSHGQSPAVKLMSKMGIWTGVQLNAIRDNSASHIADMVIKGDTMGITKMTRELNHAPVRRLGEELIDLQRRSIETLKQYL